MSPHVCLPTVDHRWQCAKDTSAVGLWKTDARIWTLMSYLSMLKSGSTPRNNVCVCPVWMCGCVPAGSIIFISFCATVIGFSALVAAGCSLCWTHKDVYCLLSDCLCPFSILFGGNHLRVREFSTNTVYRVRIYCMCDCWLHSTDICHLVLQLFVKCNAKDLKFAVCSQWNITSHFPVI